MLIRAMLWKEWREHSSVVLVLALFSISMLVAVALLAQPPNPSAPATDIVRHLGLGRLATVMLVVTTGMVCGSALFASERENGTSTFLDTLPLYRAPLWLAKLIAGFALTAGLSTIIILTAAVLGLIQSWSSVAALGIYTAMAYAWGVLGSTWTRSTLAAVGVGVLAALAAAVLLVIPLMLWWTSPGQFWLRPRGLYLFVVSMLLLPLGLSLWHFTGVDRHRLAEDRQASLRLLPFQRWTSRLSACAWLTRRQLRRAALFLFPLALFWGLMLLVPPLVPWLYWPPLALLLGVLVPVLSTSDEQTQQVYRYWGEQRLPLGTLIMTKLLGSALLLLLLLAALALPLFLRSQVSGSMQALRGYTLLAGLFRSPLFDELGWHGWRYVLLPAVYGFAAGWLCGLLIRKRVPATGVAMFLGGVGTLAWIPSLLAGGIQHWQLWTPPLVWLFTAAALLSPWVKDRLWHARGLTTLGLGLSGSVLVLAAGLGWRVLEIPDLPDGEADLAYIAAIPPFDDNLAGRDMRMAAEACARQATLLANRYDQPPRTSRESAGRRQQLEERLDNALRLGWPTPQEDPALNEWLEALFREAAPPSSSPAAPTSSAWPALAHQAARHPAGIYEYPQLLAGTTTSTTYNNARRLAAVLLGRGLQLQSQAQPDRFPDQLHACLGLIRHLRNAAPLQGFYTALDVERLTLSAVDRWLEAECSPSPQALQQAAQLLEHHDRLTAPTHHFDPTPYFLAERYLLREALNAPSQWLGSYLGLNPSSLEQDPPEVEAILLAWAVPWERERTRRIVGLGLESGLRHDPVYLYGRPGFSLILGRMRNPTEMQEHERYIRTLRRVACIRLATLHYHRQFQHYPPNLDTLLRHHLLQSLPADPYAPQAQPLRYRLVQAEVTTDEGRRGELLRNPPPALNQRYLLQGTASLPAELFVPAGEPLLWSVGPDQVDQGGRNVPISSTFNIGRPPDLVFLIAIPLRRTAQ
jgi:ABC-type transport system involved in multi-copper enzyme maturation permease subunit